jgi:carboxyl-terminal processing protease
LILKFKFMEIAKNITSVIAGILLILIGALGGYYFGNKGYEVQIKTDSPEITVINKTSQIPTTADFNRFWEVWEIVTKQHIDKPIDPNILVDGAIHGMVNAIGDPYTSYLNIEQNGEALSSLNGLYEGIGAQLGFDEGNNLIVVAPLDGSPAKAAGVRAGDRILQIEGKDTTGVSVTEAVSKIRGKAGTVSTLLLARVSAEEPFEIKIVREEIKLESVTWEDKGDGVVLIRLSRFGEATNQEWSTAINEMIAQMPNLKGIVLDVRDNPGGYLDSAVYIGSEFVSSGVIVSEAFSNGTDQEFKVDHRGKLLDNNVKIAVLINGGSASASEIVAGALKERRKAILVGERSFGKGTVQKSEEFDDGASVHVTVAKWLTPDKNWIDKRAKMVKDSVYNETLEDGTTVIGGLKPDEEVKFTDEDIQKQNDVQLNKAVELLKQK